MRPTVQIAPSGIATIALSSKILVQGTFVRKLDTGRITVRVGAKDFTGHQISQCSDFWAAP